MLSDDAKLLQLRVAQLAEKRRWTQANTTLLSTVLPRAGLERHLTKPFVWLGVQLMSLDAKRSYRSGVND